jgi:hypothetical protein
MTRLSLRKTVALAIALSATGAASSALALNPQPLPPRVMPPMTHTVIVKSHLQK